MWDQYQSVERTHKAPSAQLENLAEAVNQLSREDFYQLVQRVRWSFPFSDSACQQELDKQPTLAPNSLTKRESEVLTLVASGYSRKEIGIALSISENTAACHIASIYRKLDISTIAEATRIAIQIGAV